LSFYFIEGKWFGLLSRTRQSKFDVASCFTITRDYLKVYVEEKERLRTTLRGQWLCLTTDIWTSIQNINYICLTAHWIDNKCNLHKRFSIFVNFLII